MNRYLLQDGISHAGGFFRKNRVLIALFLTFLLSMMIGSWAIGVAPDTDCYGMESVFEQYLSSRSGQPFYMVLLSSFLAQLVLFVAAYVLGLCALGFVAAFGIIIFKGVSVGMVGGYLYLIHGLQGVGFFALILLPGLFVSGLLLLLAAKECFCFAVRLFRLLLTGSGIEPVRDLKLYSLRFVVLLAGVGLTAVIDAVMSAAFIGFFHF